MVPAVGRVGDCCAGGSSHPAWGVGHHPLPGRFKLLCLPAWFAAHPWLCQPAVTQGWPGVVAVAVRDTCPGWQWQLPGCVSWSLGVALAPGPTWSCFLQGSSAFVPVWNSVFLPFAGRLLGARGVLPEPVWPLA